jgi:hypothetical protein
MAFDVSNLETYITVDYNGVKYRVIDNSSSGLLIVAKEDDVINNNYPLQLFAIPST